MECREAERLALAVARARLGKLAGLEGCTVRLCTGDYCLEGRLEEVDVEAVTVTVATRAGRAIAPLDTGNFELTVYECGEGGGE